MGATLKCFESIMLRLHGISWCGSLDILTLFILADILDCESVRQGKLMLKYDRVKLRSIVEHVLDLTSPMVKWNVKVGRLALATPAQPHVHELFGIACGERVRADENMSVIAG